ncbi:MAG: pyridoxal phosphate-dependent class II aminotransferase [Clostridiales bacterium]|nr:pyridoxal phosphate-dependent class II aminotransferase [Clostridiales bacterium]
MHIHGGDIYSRKIRMDFSANLNFLGMPESVAQAACQGVLMSEHYPDVHCRELRSAIAARDHVDSQWILCGNGAADLIYSLVLAEKPRKAVVCCPTFHEYEQALETVGCDICWVMLEKEEDFRYTERILEAITPDTDLLVLCNPNNPTGQILPTELRDCLLERCRICHTRFLLDECFVDFLPNREENTAVNLLEAFPELIILKAFTKLYAMAGLRLGYALCTDQSLIRRMQEVSQPWNVSLPAQQAGVAACGESEYVKKYRRLLAVERERLRNAFEERGARVYGSQANYIFFQSREDLGEQLLKQGILIRDCSNYRGLGPGYFRTAVRGEDENRELIRSLDRLGNLAGTVE